MKDGFIRCAAASVDITLADPAANAKKIAELVCRADSEGVKLLCLPELCLCGYTLGDIFESQTLLDACEDALFSLAAETADCDTVFTVGLPVRHFSKLYNCAATVAHGEILGLVAKTVITNSEARFFESASSINEYEFHRFSCGVECSIGAGLLFSHESLANYIFGVEIGADAYAVSTPSARLCKNGAKIILNPAASAEIVGRAEYRRDNARDLSRRLICGYVHASAEGESTGDAVFASHSIITEGGKILAEALPFSPDSFTVCEIDVDRLSSARAKADTYCEQGGANFTVFTQNINEDTLVRNIRKNPFVPDDAAELERRCETVFSVQAHGLKKRILHTNSKKLVLGISGGLDSTLALLVAAEAMDLCGRSRADIITVTMPCFGTTDRTRSNAEKMCLALGCDFREINIKDSVRRHFADIGQDESIHDVTYENAQARERTQLLMDLANKEGGIVVGTGDMSELALGWCTYNGDHMSNYAVNCGIVKTLVRHIVAHQAGIAKENGNTALAEALFDVLDTPVSPELLPPDAEGKIAQKTEDIVGPYELHDFFLYYTVRCGFSAKKILRMAESAYKDEYDTQTLEKWLGIFMRRFFSQQFKRSCMPDGVKVGSVSLSPRGDFIMPTDASSSAFILK